jgi:hypothetical protein
MGYPSVSYSFSTGKIKSAYFNQNFADLIAALGDGSKDLNMANVYGTATNAAFANACIDTYTRTTGTSVAARGVAISASSGSWTDTTGGYVAVTNLSVTIVTSGRPVMVMLIPTTSTSSVSSAATASPADGYFKFLRDATSIGILLFSMDETATTNIPPSSLCVVDAVAAGSYTYTVQAKSNGAGDTVGVTNCKLCAYEL